MNTTMAATRYALPFNSQSHFQHVRDQQTKQEADKSTASPTSTLTPIQPRPSTGAKFTRKMQSMFGGGKEQRLARADQSEAEAVEARKQSSLRRLAADGAVMHCHRTHLGRP